MSKYRDDPRWVESRFAGTDINGRAYRKDERVWLYPRERRVISGEAAEQAAREFAGQAADEDMDSRLEQLRDHFNG